MKNIIAIIFLFPALAFGQGFPGINTKLSIGTTANTAPITVSNFATTFPIPQAGTMIHVVSDNVVNGRVSLDTYNNTSFTGSNYSGRRARGTAAIPTAAIADDILVTLSGDAYGLTGYTGISLAAITLRSEGTMTDISKPTYQTFNTTPVGAAVSSERMRIKSTGAMRFNAYGVGAITGTPAYSLQVNSLGDIIEGSLGGGASWGSITGTLSSQSDLQTALNLKANTSAMPVFLNLASNFSNSTVTQTPVTGWSFPITTGKTYRIEIIGAYQSVALTTGGTIGVYLTSGAGTIRGNAEMDIAQTAVATGLKAPLRTCTTLGAAGSSLTSTGVGLINSPHGVYLIATFTCTSTGVLQIGWASEVAASASQLNANSSLIYQMLN